MPHELSDTKGSRTGLMTGYYEPLLKGSRTRGGPFQIPLYRTPKDLINVDLSSVYPEIKSLRLRGRLEGNRVVPYPTRAEIERKGLLVGEELLWVDDPVEAFFLQVQGSGRVQLPTGETVRVGYAEQNGYPYRSIGRYLIDKGELKPNDARCKVSRPGLPPTPIVATKSCTKIRAWCFFEKSLHCQVRRSSGIHGTSADRWTITSDRSTLYRPRQRGVSLHSGAQARGAAKGSGAFVSATHDCARHRQRSAGSPSW